MITSKNERGSHLSGSTFPIGALSLAVGVLFPAPGWKGLTGGEVVVVRAAATGATTAGRGLKKSECLKSKFRVLSVRRTSGGFGDILD